MDYKTVVRHPVTFKLPLGRWALAGETAVCAQMGKTFKTVEIVVAVIDDSKDSEARAIAQSVGAVFQDMKTPLRVDSLVIKFVYMPLPYQLTECANPIELIFGKQFVCMPGEKILDFPRLSI
jgi:hypothetical protein